MHARHYFFALALPNEVKTYIAGISAQLKSGFPFKNWVHRDDYHITLAFLGNAKEQQLADAANLVKESLRDFPSFQLELHEAGVFGRPASPRVFWVNTADSDPLLKLREKVFISCEKAGFQLETRPFKPHITIARKWMDKEDFLLEVAKESVGLNLPGPIFTAAEAVLYQTHMNRTPKYEKVESFKLI